MGNYSRIESLYSTIILIQLLVYFVQASINDDEDRVNSEGMWQSLSQEQKLTHISTRHGNSRFDVGGILTAIGLQQGANIMGLVIFPILFPLMILFGMALFIISMFGTASSVVTSGRRLDSNGDEYDVTSKILNLNHNVLDGEACIERIACEIFQRIGDNPTSKKALRLLGALSVFPDSILKFKSAIRQGRSDCSTFRCNFRNLIANKLT